jgi:asparagine synthetase B (glutamine-hydrolysing)
MAHGLEVRVPMLSKNFIAFSLGLKKEHKAHFLKAKILPKRYLKQELGSEINFNKKSGFSCDLTSILTPALIDDFLKETPKEHKLFELIDYDNFNRLVKNKKTVNDSRYCIYSVINLKFWLDHSL